MKNHHPALNSSRNWDLYSLKKQRWYAGFEYTGNSKKLIESISLKVREHQLSDILPLVRVEKNPSKKFIFFIAIESESRGQFPEKFEIYMRPLPYFNRPVIRPNCFHYDEIKCMVGGETHDVEDYTYPIPYIIADSKVIQSDPFNSISDRLEKDFLPNSVLTKLLDYLSAQGNGTWQSFQNICRILKIEEPSRVLRNLKLLGHLETSPNGKKWSIGPTALIPLNYNPENLEFYLCGQQNFRLRQELAQLANITEKNQPENYAPSCFKIQFYDRKIYEEIKNICAIKIHKPGNIAQQIAECLPTIQEWQATLPVVGSIVPSQNEWKLYKFGNFQDHSLPDQTGLYEMRYNSKQQYPDGTLFYDSEKNIWRKGDWYGLRFLALQYQTDPKYQLRSCCYNSQTSQLAIVYNERWPQLYERALVLASGQLPVRKQVDAVHWLIYSNITPDLAYWLTEQLSLICQGLD